MKKFLADSTIRKHLIQGFKFGICGLTGFSIEFVILTLLVEKFHIVPWIANLPAGLASITFVFFFNKYITFRNKERSRAQTMRFILVYSCAFVGSYIFYAALLWLHVQYQLGKVIVVGTVAIINYCLSHGFIFKKVEHLPDVVTV